MKFQCKLVHFKKQDGSTFAKVTAKGCNLPHHVGTLPEEYYNVKGALTPNIEYDDGIYMIQCEDVWMDMRPQYLGKNILRLKGDIEITLIKRI